MKKSDGFLEFDIASFIILVWGVVLQNGIISLFVRIYNSRHIAAINNIEQITEFFLICIKFDCKSYELLIIAQS